MIVEGSTTLVFQVQYSKSQGQSRCNLRELFLLKHLKALQVRCTSKKFESSPDA